MGHPVQQPRVAGATFGRATKIAGVGHQSDAEMPVPNAVGDQPRGQTTDTVVRIGEPVRQLQPAALLGIAQLVVEGGQNAREASRYLVPLHFRFAAQQHRHVPHLVVLDRHHQEGPLRGRHLAREEFSVAQTVGDTWFGGVRTGKNADQ